MIGWFGLISLVLTPFILLNNIVNYLKSIGLPDPELSAIQMSFGSIPPPGPGSLKLPLILGGVAWTAVLCGVASQQVGFIEKHFPTINARLHAGEIKDDTDAQYSGIQIGKDIRGLETNIKANHWTEMRSELLARQALLTDLTNQNLKLQRQVQREREANLEATDACEKWAIEEMAPALNGYTVSEKQLFAFVEANPKTAQDTDGIRRQLVDRHEEYVNKYVVTFFDANHRACDK